MQQRDILKDQIEQLGKVLAKVLSDFLGLKAQGNVAQAVEMSNEKLQAELDINIEKLIALKEGDLSKYLTSRVYTDEHLEFLSEYLVELGKTKTTKLEVNSYLQKAIALLDLADEVSESVSFERMNKKSQTENLLS